MRSVTFFSLELNVSNLYDKNVLWTTFWIGHEDADVDTDDGEQNAEQSNR